MMIKKDKKERKKERKRGNERARALPRPRLGGGDVRPLGEGPPAETWLAAAGPFRARRLPSPVASAAP